MWERRTDGLLNAESGALEKDRVPVFPRLSSHASVIGSTSPLRNITERKVEAVTTSICLQSIDSMQADKVGRIKRGGKRRKGSLKVLSECVIMCDYLSACALFSGNLGRFVVLLSSPPSAGPLILSCAEVESI